MEKFPWRAIREKGQLSSSNCHVVVRDSIMAEKIKILCVDDERNVLKALRRLFMDEEDYGIPLAESGEEGLEILDMEHDIRLVVSDYRMPGMNWVEFLAQVNEEGVKSFV